MTLAESISQVLVSVSLTALAASVYLHVRWLKRLDKEIATLYGHVTASMEQQKAMVKIIAEHEMILAQKENTSG